jgi:heptosyltransferase-2
MGPRVLIVKLGALGDVVRTACLLPGLAAQVEAPYVTWLTSRAARPLVERMPGAHRVLEFGPEALAALEVEHFDTIISLDKEPAPCAVAMKTPAQTRLGIGLSRYGTVYPLNDECDYYFSLGLDNNEKFHGNRKSYPQLVYEALGMVYAGETYRLEPTPADRAWAGARLAALGAGAAGRRLVGINPGAGAVFAHKAWRPEGYIELIRAAARARPDVDFLLLGGGDERELLERLRTETAGAPVFNAGADCPLGGFMALIERCAVLVAGDTLAMHLAVATGRRTVAIFGPTCAQEIDLFGRGEKIVSPIDCAPCYLRACDKSPHCQDMIPAARVLEALLRQLAAA